MQVVRPLIGPLCCYLKETNIYIKAYFLDLMTFGRNQSTQASIVGTNLEIEVNNSGMSIPNKDLCGLCEIDYTGQSVQVKGDTIEIDPPREGYQGVSIPVKSILNFYNK